VALRLCSLDQHFEGPSECCGMLTACSVEAVSASFAWGIMRPSKPTHSMMMEPWIHLVDRRASVSANRDLIAADVVTEGIGVRFHRERHGSRKRDRLTKLACP